MPEPAPLNSDQGTPHVQFFANHLGDEPFMFIDGRTVYMTDWVRSVEARLAALASDETEVSNG